MLLGFMLAIRGLPVGVEDDLVQGEDLRERVVALYPPGILLNPEMIRVPLLHQGLLAMLRDNGVAMGGDADRRSVKRLAATLYPSGADKDFGVNVLHSYEERQAVPPTATWPAASNCTFITASPGSRGRPRIAWMNLWQSTTLLVVTLGCLRSRRYGTSTTYSGSTPSASTCPSWSHSLALTATRNCASVPSTTRHFIKARRRTLSEAC